MNKIYFATKLYNAYDKLRTLRLEEYLIKRLPKLETYMPYRDSDEENITKNWKQTIFQRDISEINSSDFVIGYWDGPCFDEGVGFEIGYALMKGKRVIILNDDFLSYGSSSTNPFKFSDPIISLFGLELIDVRFNMYSSKSYGYDLEEAIVLALEKVYELVIQEHTINIYNCNDNSYASECRKYYFETGSSLSIFNKVNNICSISSDHTCSNRFLDFAVTSAKQDFAKALKAEKLFAVAYNIELAPGTSILCGMRYASELPYYIITDKKYSSYSMTGEMMPTNLMVDMGSGGYISWKDCSP